MRYVDAKDEEKKGLVAIVLSLLGRDKEPVTLQQDGEDVAVVLSPEQFDMFSKIRKEQIKKFFAARNALAEEAQRNGLTEEKLAEILSE